MTHYKLKGGVNSTVTFSSPAKKLILTFRLEIGGSFKVFLKVGANEGQISSKSETSVAHLSSMVSRDDTGATKIGRASCRERVYGLV